VARSTRISAGKVEVKWNKKTEETQKSAEDILRDIEEQNDPNGYEDIYGTGEPDMDQSEKGGGQGSGIEGKEEEIGELFSEIQPTISVRALDL